MKSFMLSESKINLITKIDRLQSKNDSLALELAIEQRQSSSIISKLQESMRYAMLFGNPKNADEAVLKANAAKLNIRLYYDEQARLVIEMSPEIAENLFGYQTINSHENWPVLQKLENENKVVVLIVREAMTMGPGLQVPEIVVPDFAVSGLESVAQKRVIAKRYYSYIEELFGTYPQLPPALFIDFKRLERERVPDNNADKIIEFRLRFIIFLKQNIRNLVTSNYIP